MVLKEHELILVTGGGYSSAILTSVSRLMKQVYDIGFSLGSSIRRIFTRNYCK